MSVNPSSGVGWSEAGDVRVASHSTPTMYKPDPADRSQLPNPPLPPPPATAIAIITKPPQRTYKDLLASPEHNIKFINRVVDTDKLRGKWKPFEARRNLARENDLWLADERIIPSLPKLLGKVFFDAKK